MSDSTATTIGTRRELFVDHSLVDVLEEASLSLHHPREEEVALRFDDPWVRHGGYVTVIHDADVYRMYYKTTSKTGADDASGQATCYAESRDGIRFTKPNLELFEVEGWRENNVTHFGDGPTSHNFTPMLDTRPGVPADERFKALAGTKETGLIAFASADGVRWRRLYDHPVFPEWHETKYDSQNVSFWSDHEGCYVCYYRIFEEGIRTVVRAISDDYEHWRDDRRMSFGDTELEHLYINQTHPYFRAPHIYVALAARFHPGRQVISDQEGEAFGVNAYQGVGYWHDVSDAVLLTSRGGWEYDRTFMESFVRPGRDRRNWVSRCNYPALGVVQTGEDEMSMYITRHNQQPTGHIQRLSMRLDGFASLSTGYGGGRCVTKPVIFEGRRLLLNYSTGAGGHVRVGITEPDGRAIPGFAASDCVPAIGDEIEREMRWTGGDCGALAGRPVRLRFEAADADLFSFQFTA